MAPGAAHPRFPVRFTRSFPDLTRVRFTLRPGLLLTFLPTALRTDPASILLIGPRIDPRPDPAGLLLTNPVSDPLSNPPGNPLTTLPPGYPGVFRGGCVTDCLVES